jgi:membrane protease YdiL (CAAX protease family)
MTEQQENLPESTVQEQIPVEEISFIDRHGINPLAFAIGSLVLIFLLYQVGGGLLTYLIVGITPVTADNAWTIRWLTAVGQIGLILIPTLLLTKMFARRLHYVFRFRVPGLLESAFALIALVSLIFVFQAYMFFQGLVPLPELLREFIEPLKKAFEELTRVIVHAGSPMELMVVILVIAVVPAITEEFFFRGLIQKVFERLLSPAVAAILTGTIFGLFHFNPMEAVPLIGIGVFLGMLRYRSQTLILPIIVHFINNFIAILALHYGLNDENLLIQQQSVPDARTMLLTLIGFTALFFISFVAYLRITHDTSRNIY